MKKELFVMDCSITMAWILPGESNKATDEILNLLENTHAKVPSLWPLEVSNVLWIAERSKKLTALDVAEFKEFLSALPIFVDDETSLHAMGSIYTLAKSENLTVYDAAYLELSIRESCSIATLDKALKKAAIKQGVKVLI